MIRTAFVLLLLHVLINPTQAQSWGERQQIYNEKANLEMEMFQQREEMERMRQEHKRSMDAQRRELEQQQQEILRAKKDIRNKRTLPDVGMENYPSSIDANTPEELRRQQEAIETKEFVEKELESTQIIFNNDASSLLYSALTDMGAHQENISRVMYARKAMYLRIENDALRGNAEDQRKLAVAYFEGDAVKLNHNEALRWFRSAAENGDAEAQTYLGRFYFEGTIVSRDYKLSADWYMKAAQQGYSEAQFMVGSLYLLGRGLSQDDEKSYEWFRKAADKGHGNAQYVLGLRYHDGSRLPKDDVEAAFWFRLAALNKADYLNDIKNMAFTASVIGQLSPADRTKVGERVANWEPIRTKEEQGAFNQSIAVQDNLVRARLAGLYFSEDQASRVLDGYKRHLFGAGKVRSMEASQMKALFGQVETALDKMGGGTGRHEAVTQQLISGWSGNRSVP